MHSILYDIAAGLDLLVPGANYSGTLQNNTESEYNSITWDDGRTKPTWAEVDEAALDVMRNYIANKIIDVKTQYNIENTFETTLDTTIYIYSTCVWQFNALNLWLNRNNTNLVTYPYDLGVSVETDGTVNYLTLDNASEVDTLYTEMYTHVNDWLDSGRTLKNSLPAKTKQELLDFEDTRT